MIEAWKKQFSLKQLSPAHDEPLTFVISQWQTHCKPSPIYLIYRWIVAIMFFVTLIISILDIKHPDGDAAFKAKWLIYLTHWGYTACTFQALLVALMLTFCLLGTRFGRTKIHDNALKFYKLYWITNTIATVIAFGITTIYWSLIYDPQTMDLDALNILFHANNSVMMIVDLFIVSHPIRLLHFCYPVLFGMYYCIFSVIYYLAGGISREGQTYIYTILNWAKPGTTTVICVMVMGYVILIHVMMWGLHKLRIWISSKIFVEEGEVATDRQSSVVIKNYYSNEALSADV